MMVSLYIDAFEIYFIIKLNVKIKPPKRKNELPKTSIYDQMIKWFRQSVGFASWLLPVLAESAGCISPASC